MDNEICNKNKKVINTTKYLWQHIYADICLMLLLTNKIHKKAYVFKYRKLFPY